MSPRRPYDGPYDFTGLEEKGMALAAALALRDRAMAALEVEVRRAAKAGVPKERIVRAAGVSKPTVYRILRGS